MGVVSVPAPTGFKQSWVILSGGITRLGCLFTQCVLFCFVFNWIHTFVLNYEAERSFGGKDEAVRHNDGI